MPEISIFDSLTHPMPNGNWLEGRYDGWGDAGILREAMRRNDVKRVLAVGMGEGVGGYREESYAEWVRAEIPGALPIAWYGFEESRPSDYAGALREAGYVGIKIHPRLAGIDFTHPELPGILRAAHAVDMPVMICTYNYARHKALERTGLDAVRALLDQAGDGKVILVHGGLFRALEWAEAMKYYPGVLLDLSYTLTRFAGSSLDLDLRWLFENFDRRICIGSDHPELSLDTLRGRFDQLAEGLDREKAENIAHRNLNACFGLDPW